MVSKGNDSRKINRQKKGIYDTLKLVKTGTFSKDTMRYTCAGESMETGHYQIQKGIG